jgi:nicotinamide-nucleotide amidase
MQRADIVITSGGLGPTQGDITKFVSAEICKKELYLDEASLEHIKSYARRRGFPMTENNVRQAMIPEGATVFKNYCGTAPGVALEKDGKVIINLPGPPPECTDMYEKSVVPYLTEKYGAQSIIESRILNTFGIGESLLEEKLMDLIKNQHNPTLALLVRPSGVIVRITAKADDKQAAEKMIADMENEIRSRIAEFIYATDDCEMEKIVGNLLRENSLKIACAESCTGGLLTSRLTDVAGSSAYVLGSVVSYTNEIKTMELGVKKETLARFGAVSEETAIEMAEGIKKKFSADIGIGITGIAGPDGGTPAKPTGLVYIALAVNGGTKVFKNQFSNNRKSVKFRAAQTALDKVRRYILGI